MGVHVQSASAAALEKLVGDVVHQGAVAAVRPLKPWDEHDLSAALDDLAEDPLLLVLDGITDPHNLGACLRTADAAGVHAVVLPKDRSASLDGVARKVAAGAAEFVAVVTVTNLVRSSRCTEKARHLGGGHRRRGHANLVRGGFETASGLGSWGGRGGMRRLTREHCDFMVRIPMAGQVASLNVSVAAGVALFEARIGNAVDPNGPERVSFALFFAGRPAHSLPHRSQREAQNLKETQCDITR